MVNKALEIAKLAHFGQVDKGGNPYILHPMTVSEAVQAEDEKIVALLHDTIEDTDLTLDDLRKYGFSAKIIGAIDAITKRNGEDYGSYIERVKQNSFALNVKIADIMHNMDISRITNPTTKDFNRIERYKKTLKHLVQ